jgi:hypothetical protein
MFSRVLVVFDLYKKNGKKVQKGLEIDSQICISLHATLSEKKCIAP